MATLTLIVNGSPRTLDVPPGESLLETLRERFGTSELKDGCAPQGQCGCCLALVDGIAKTTCAMRRRALRRQAGRDPRGRVARPSAS